MTSLDRALGYAQAITCTGVASATLYTAVTTQSPLVKAVYMVVTVVLGYVACETCDRALSGSHPAPEKT